MKRDAFDLMDTAVGDTIVVVDSYGRDRAHEATVTRVGRVNLAIEQYGREQVFERATGVEKRHANAGGSPARAYEPGAYEAWQERQRLLDDLTKVFGYASGSMRRMLTLDQLRRIAMIVAEGED